MSEKDILLCTLNSTYQHSSFGLRYLLANLGELQEKAEICEWTIKENPRTIVEKILLQKPKIVGFSLYIWNTNETLDVIMILKKIAPEMIIVLGGPEISFETESQAHLHYCDYVIKGEAETLFFNLCQNILQNNILPDAKIISGELPDIKRIKMPYDLYSDADIQNRVIYVEASRGCPYKCEYCLSSLDKSVRNFEIMLFLDEMQKLLNRGLRTFKFVDRTFNLSPSVSTQILKFFLDQIHLGLFLHFELVPDRLPQEIKDLIKQFPEGSLQFEVGIQTLNPQVAQNVSRKNDLTKVADNFAYLNQHTHVHTHADLIVGLPGESLESFAEGFNRLSFMGPDEIQVGILKRLKGTPIARHEKTFKMIYSDSSPFQILSTSTMDYVTLQKMNRFAKFWDLYANSGEFKNFMKWLREDWPSEKTFFWRFFEYSEYLAQNFSETHSISLINLAEKAWRFMLAQGLDADLAADIIQKDYCYGVKRRDLPVFLKAKNKQLESANKNKVSHFNQRQINHL